MAKKSKVALTCPRCGKAWEIEPNGLKRADPSYRSAAKEAPYLVECPHCGGRWRYVAPSGAGQPGG
jgi:DNA-directed RNA polymerase subunit M/transcription elongation factor TFIIS